MPLLTVENAISKAQIFAFRGISFPLASYGTEFTHDIAQHKKPDRPGARLENTGRNPMVFSGRALFRNGAVFDISANTSEPLYPNVYKAFLLACADGSTGDLVHPELGIYRAKCASFKGDVTGERTDGADVSVSFVEDNEDSDGDLGTVAPLAFASASAEDVDSELTALKAKNAGLAKDLAGARIGSFADTLRQVRATADSITLIQKQYGAIIPSMQHDLQTTSDSLDRLGDVSAHNARAAVERLKAALWLVKQTQLVTGSVLRYTVPTFTTLGQLAGFLHNTPADLITLNPSLANVFPPAVIQPATTIRYYPSKVA